MKTKLVATVFSMALLALPAHGIDHSNLDEGRPLRLEDAYPIATGELTLETGAGFRLPRRGPDYGFFPIEVLYGAFRGMHIGAGTTLTTRPDDVQVPQRTGDLHLSALYNFNMETLTWPALGLKGELKLPTGVDSRGVDFELKGLLTKSMGRLSFHLNGGYEFIGDPRAAERSGRYRFAFGPSYPIGAPFYTRTVILADAFVEQSHDRGERETAGIEAGFRHQLTERIVVDAGIGSELSGPPRRAPFYLTTGISIAF
jgi:hypothetical protein